MDAVWTRVQAKERRSFEEAFEGVFLESPEYLYQRFIAEYTYEVMAEEQALGKSESTLWYNAQFDLSNLVLGPDQNRVAFIETNKKGDSHIKVVNLKANAELEKEFKEQQQTLLEEDPQDIAAKRPKVFNRKAERTLQERNFSSIRNLRWYDAQHIWFTAISNDAQGFRHQDIFQWNINTGAVKQLTEQANLRRFDISPDRTFVIAEHTEVGKSGLFKFGISGDKNQVKVASQGEAITPFDIAHVYDFPRLNPKNKDQLAYLRNAPNQPWALYITDLANRESRLTVPMPKDYQFLSYPQWSNDGNSLYFVTGSQTMIKLYQYQLASKQLFEVTKGQELVAWPVELEKEGQKSLLHVSMMSRGPDIFKRDIHADKLVQVSAFTDTQNFDYLQKNTDSEFMIAKAKIDLDSSIGEERDYSVFDHDITLTLAGTNASASYKSKEIGIKGGDLLQKLNWNLTAMSGSGDLKSGFSGNLEWQGLPVHLKAHAYQIEFSDEVTSGFQNAYGKGNDRNLNGYSFTAELPYGIASSTYKGKASVSYLSNQSDALDTKGFRLEHKQSWFLDRVKWGLVQHSSLQLLSGDTDLNGTTDDWRGVQGNFGVAANAFGFGLAVNYEHAERSDSDYKLLQLGGIGSGVLTPETHMNWILSPELSLGYAQGNKYQNTKISFYKRHSNWQLYYAEP